MSVTTIIDTGIRKEKCLNTKKDPFVLLPHQENVKNYFVNSPHRGLLLYHLLGSGKTCSAISISDELLNLKKVDKVYVCTPGSLRENFVNEYCKKCGFDVKNLNKYTFITYNTDIFDAIKKLDFNNSLVIIDEAHNLINGARNISKNPLSLYNQILNSNARVLVLTATIIYSNILEWCLIGNLLKDKTFPNVVENKKKINIDLELDYEKIFNSESMSGIVSYFPGYTTEYPEVIHHDPIIVLLCENHGNKLSEMIKYEIEKSIVLNNKKKKGEILTESEEIDLVLCQKKIRSRAISNIFYDFIDDEKPLQKYSEFEKLIFDIIDDIQKYNEEKFGIRNKNKGIDKNNIIKKLKEKLVIDKKIPVVGKDEIGVIEKVIKEFSEIEKRDYLVSEGGMIDHDFLKNHTLNYLCPKIVAIIVNILKNFNTKQVIFSFFINKNGLLFIHNILKICNINTEIYSGEVSAKNRQKILDKFNSEENRYGKIIKVLLVTEAGCEGITMLEVEHVHFLETNTNANKSLQCVGRAARFRSHVNMPPDRKKVNIWRYYATPSSFEMDYSLLKNFNDYYNYYIKMPRSRFITKGLGLGIDEMLDLQNKENIVDYKKFYDMLQKYSIENTGLINILKKSNIDIVRDIFKNHKEDNITKKDLKKILKKMGINIEKDELNEIINKLQDE